MGLGLLDNQSKPIDHQYLGMAYAVTLKLPEWVPHSPTCQSRTVLRTIKQLNSQIKTGCFAHKSMQRCRTLLASSLRWMLVAMTRGITPLQPGFAVLATASCSIRWAIQTSFGSTLHSTAYSNLCSTMWTLRQSLPVLVHALLCPRYAASVQQN